MILPTIFNHFFYKISSANDNKTVNRMSDTGIEYPLAMYDKSV